MNRNSCWWTAGKPQWYPPHLLLQVLPNKFKCKDYITWTDKKWNQVCIQGPAPICMWSAPQKYQRDTTELTASGKTRHKEPWAQVSWCCQGPMAQIRTAEHLQDLLMGMKSKHHPPIRQNSGDQDRCSWSEHRFSKWAVWSCLVY